MESLAKMGIDGWMMLWQAVNFLMLLFVLYKFAYNPLLHFLDDRSAKIQKGLEDAEEAKKLIALASEKQEDILSNAQREAKKILVQAEEQSKKRSELLLSQSEDQAKKILDDARKQSQEDSRRLLNDAKSELSELVLLTVEKVVRQKMESDADVQLVKKLIS